MCKNVKNIVKILPLLLILLGSIQICAQSDGKIAEIRRIYKETNEKIAAAEKNFRESEVYFTELVVNKGGTSYPPVGNYLLTAKFYYTFGDRESDVYPNRLLKVVVTSQSAAREYYKEFIFDKNQNLVFYYINGAEGEHRMYFANGKLIRWQKGKKLTNVNAPEAKGLLKEVNYQKNRFMEIFKNSL